MTPEEIALRTTYGVWAWLLSLDDDRLTAHEVKRVVDRARDLYDLVRALEAPQLALIVDDAQIERLERAVGWCGPTAVAARRARG